MPVKQGDLFGPRVLLPADYAWPADAPLVVSYGGGVNSIAMLIGFVDRGIHPDAIVFSDTRGEKPETYAYLRDVLPPWLARVGFPPLTVVSRADFGRSHTGDRSLEEECLRLGTLPSRAYGYGTCADKWKIDPFKYWAQTWEPARAAWATGRLVARAIGYDAGEAHRIGHDRDSGYGKVYPLLEWLWDREDCEEACACAGLPVPPKSACFYCPSSHKEEVLELAVKHPDLLQRALSIEHAAMATGRWGGVKGLGRRFAWARLVEADEHDRAALPDAPVEPCMKCHI